MVGVCNRSGWVRREGFNGKEQGKVEATVQGEVVWAGKVDRSGGEVGRRVWLPQ